jgi:hypothetical protein
MILNKIRSTCILNNNVVNKGNQGENPEKLGQ